jgi:ABC-type Na+ efflux pump permease subunit
MENKHIIIILLVIIVVLAMAIGFVLLNLAHAKEPTKVKVTSDKEQYEGGKLSIELTDLNRTPLSKEVVNITITDKKGKVVVDDVVKTNSKGKAKLDFNLKKGKYTVNVTYGGNENYTGNSTTQNLKTKKAATKTISSSSQSSSGTKYDINNLPPSNDPYPETNRYFIDENHVKQEYQDGYMRTVDVRTGEIHSLGFK